jgi:hypothetical protein
MKRGDLVCPGIEMRKVVLITIAACIVFDLWVAWMVSG